MKAATAAATMTSADNESPDWRHDPRATDETKARVAHHRRWSRVAAVVAAALLVVGGMGYLGFVTGRLSLPGLGTLTQHPAGISTFQVGETTYLMQDHGDNHIEVGIQLTTTSTETVADLAVPANDTLSWARVDNRVQPDLSGTQPATYVGVLPAGAHNLLVEAKDSSVTPEIVIAPVRSASGRPDLVGIVVTIRPAAAIDTLTKPGVSTLRWEDSDGRVHTHTAG
ncbi:MAG: hypothetical protein ABI890_09025 [Lapillicoccus sp.]